ncbi:hypothetical protein HY638_02625 [Candidatus Woesearchaeota archaeon]|nr:hypothetical protein [Candidatus Woesearchaeota archaeon]
MKKRAEYDQLILVLAISILVIGGVMLLAVFKSGDSFSGMAAGGVPGPPGGSPPGGGGGGGGGAGGGTGTGTTTTESGGGGGIQKVVGVVARNPENLETLKRGSHLFLTQVYYAGNPSGTAKVNAESSFFGKLILPLQGPDENGVYGLNITINKSIAGGRYKILYTAEQASQYDEFAILVNIDPELRINTSLGEEHFKGQNLEIKGHIYDFNATPQEGVNVTISASYDGGLIFKKETSTGKKGFFSDVYPLSFGEPDGTWDIKITATDKYGNEGNAGAITKVSTPKGVAFYTVTFLSPLANGEFRRGSLIPITVEVEDKGNPVINATVGLKSPQSQIITLDEASPGTYTAEYQIGPDDPVGKWYVAVQAVAAQNGIIKAGGNKVPVNIGHALISIVLSKPVPADFFTGQKENIEARVTYGNDIPVENAQVSASVGNRTVSLEEGEAGIYQAPYLFTESDKDAGSIEISASDIYGNSASATPKPISVEPVGPVELKARLFYYNVLLRYWYLFVAGSVFLVLATRPLWYPARLNSRLRKVSDEEKRTIEMEKDIQRKYFKEHCITRDNYDGLMAKYRERIQDLKESKLALQEKLRKHKA